MRICDSKVLGVLMSITFLFSLQALHHVGTRHFPGDTKRMPPKGRERVEKFEMKPMRDYYQEFPGLVRSSFPLYVRKAGKQVSSPLNFEHLVQLSCIDFCTALSISVALVRSKVYKQT